MAESSPTRSPCGAGPSPRPSPSRSWSSTWRRGVAHLGTPTPDPSKTADYGRFWTDVGERFPDLGGAASTRYYFEDEQRLLSQHLPSLRGIRLLKTDLWDEARNTRILAWAESQGALPYGIDVSPTTLSAARRAFQGTPGLALGDVRDMPFSGGRFDAIYSMGTIEHFDQTERAVEEMFRVLRPGGTAIVGVPNRWDPFLRPLLVTLLSRLGLYGYGYEKSYSRRALREMLQRAGFEVKAETGILFMPGGLRIVDLFLYSYCRPLSFVTAPFLALFAWIGRRLPLARRHGYLLATVVIKPE